jgi:hypothetical protein
MRPYRGTYIFNEALGPFLTNYSKTSKNSPLKGRPSQKGCISIMRQTSFVGFTAFISIPPFWIYQSLEALRPLRSLVAGLDQSAEGSEWLGNAANRPGQASDPVRIRPIRARGGGGPLHSPFTFPAFLAHSLHRLPTLTPFTLFLHSLLSPITSPLTA